MIKWWWFGWCATMIRKRQVGRRAGLEPAGDERAVHGPNRSVGEWVCISSRRSIRVKERESAKAKA